MIKSLKIIFGVIGILVLCITLDLVFIFNVNKPLFAIKARQPYTYIGIFYDTYNCPEYSMPQIKLKGTKFSCLTGNNKKVIDIVDTTKNIKNFSCAEALEEFYEDENYTYYYNCVKTKYVIVRYENGYEETVRDALNNQNIKIKDLDKYNINYIKYDKKNN